jgi:hypothetical protein
MAKQFIDPAWSSLRHSYDILNKTTARRRSFSDLDFYSLRREAPERDAPTINNKGETNDADSHHRPARVEVWQQHQLWQRS